MTISSASKLLNFRVPALQNLIRRHLIRPSASTNLVPDAHFADPPRLPKEDLSPRFRSPFGADETNSPVFFNASFRFSVMQSDAARKLGGSESVALANGVPRGRKASYDSEPEPGSGSESDYSDADADYRDSYEDIDEPGSEFSDEDESLDEGDGATDDEDYEEIRTDSKSNRHKDFDKHFSQSSERPSPGPRNFKPGSPKNFQDTSGIN